MISQNKTEHKLDVDLWLESQDEEIQLACKMAEI